MKHLYLLVLFLIICGNADAQLWRLVKKKEVKNDGDSSITLYQCEVGAPNLEIPANISSSVIPYDTSEKRVSAQYMIIYRNGMVTDVRKEEWYYNTNNDIKEYNIYEGQKYLNKTYASTYSYKGNYLDSIWTYEYSRNDPRAQPTLYKVEEYKYDNVGKVIERGKYKTKGGGVIYFYKYNSQGLKVCDSIISSNGVEIRSIDYNGSGKAIQLTTIIRYSSNIDTYFNYYKRDAQNRIVESEFGATPNRMAEFRNLYVYDNLGNLIIDSFWTSNSSFTQYKLDYVYKYTYNKFNLVTQKEDLLNSTITYYYYEHYWPAGVQEQVDDSIQLKVYPNPASNGVLTIRAELKLEEGVAFTITDMQGKQLMHWQDKTGHNYTKQIPVSHLPAGMYILMLEAGSSKTTRQFIVR